MPAANDTVLVPGFMCDAGLWDDMLGALAALGRLHHADLSRDGTLAGMAARAVQDAPRRSLLIGFSMGGYVARQMAISAPERVAGLVHVNTSAHGTTAERRSRNRDMVEVVRRSTFRGLPRGALEASVHPDRCGDQTLLERIQTMVLRLGKDAFMRQLALERADEHTELRRIRCPTLVASRHDRLRSPAEAEELVAGIAGAHYRILEDSGHMAPFEDPQGLGRTILEWLERERPT